MTSNRPYLLRAIHQWILDNQLTPYLLVDATVAGVEVPPQAVKDGKVVLNLAPHAVSGLQMENELVHFNARFSGVARPVVVPMAAVSAIYAQENGQGLMFQPEDAPPPDAPPAGPSGDDTPPRPGPHLRVVK
ncbi:MAG TPA: ClpXP protease specificity-enhancing factor [Rhodanobacteraceae bacterium]|nr:ClpXP protease specificity-enhancing factor [Rhodanobacteraceae bacterium]